MAKSGTSRRHFFFGTVLAGMVPAGGFGSVASLKQLGYKSPNEKLNYAAIGAGGKGYVDITGCQSENLVAMADPDDKRAEKTYQEFPKVPKYKDFRKMLDKEDKNIDAVLVSCPDFMHGTAAMWAMSRGKHVYCQKPLTHTIWEAHELMLAARKYNVATQMGNQGYSNEGARECCEIIWNGDIGNVTEVHAWKRQFRRRSIGISGWESRKNGLTARPTSRTTGGDFRLLAAAPSATWPATSWAPRIWRCD
jgi:predicted dehydrogenase